MMLLLPTPNAYAQSAAAFPQTVSPLTNLGPATIHSGPVASGALAPQELQPADKPAVGVKNQTTGGMAALLAGAATHKVQSFTGRRHGLRIPSKEDGRTGAAQLSVQSQRSQGSWGSGGGLPPPPTDIPNPRGSRVYDASGNTFGFDGLTHYDQRVAGTGIYTNTQFSLEPPDQGLCAGNGFVVEAVNNAIAVYDTSGNRLSGPTALSEFWGLTPEIDRTTLIFGQFISDPKCAYDSQTQRWFVTELMQDNGNGGSNRNFNLIAVSQSSDPRDGFTVFGYDVTDDGLNGTPAHASCPCFGDQPLLGFDAYGVYQSTNEFSATTFNGAQIYALPKQALVDAANGNPTNLYVVRIDASQGLASYGGLAYTVQPAVGQGEDNQDSSGQGVQFFLSALQFGYPPYQLLDNRIAVWAMGNTRSLAGSRPRLSMSVDVIGSQTYGQPNPAQQKPGPIPLGSTYLTSLFGQPAEGLMYLNSNDDRMNQVVYAGGVLYGGLNTIIGDGSRTGVAWFGVRPSYGRNGVSGRMVSQGYVAVDGQNVLFPSLAFAGEEHGVMAFTLVGPDYYPSAAYVKVDEGNTSSVRIAANGVAPDDGFSGYLYFSGGNVGRWGDYSAAVSDGNTVWFATEYIPNLPRTVLANWGTYIGMLKP